jgi:general secretion pathway protein B
MVTKAVLAPRLPGTPVPKAAEPAPAATTPTPAALATPSAPVALAPPATIATSRPTSPGALPPAAITVPPASDRILSIAELPADVQRDLPKLSISGGVHSENAAQRMLIVGGQVMTEGQEVAAGVVLEQIRARSAVLRFRGLRYSVVY